MAGTGGKQGGVKKVNESSREYYFCKDKHMHVDIIFFKFWKVLLQIHNKEWRGWGAERPRSGYCWRGLYLYLCPYFHQENVFVFYAYN